MEYPGRRNACGRESIAMAHEAGGKGIPSGTDCRKTPGRCRRGRSLSDFHSYPPALPAGGWLFEGKAKSLRDGAVAKFRACGRDQGAFRSPFGRAKAFDSIHLDGIERSLRDLTFQRKVNLAEAKPSALASTQWITCKKDKAAYFVNALNAGGKEIPSGIFAVPVFKTIREKRRKAARCPTAKRLKRGVPGQPAQPFAACLTIGGFDLRCSRRPRRMGK